MKEAYSGITLEEIKSRYAAAQSTHASSKRNVMENVTLGKVEGAVKVCVEVSRTDIECLWSPEIEMPCNYRLSVLHWKCWKKEAVLKMQKQFVQSIFLFRL